MVSFFDFSRIVLLQTRLCVWQLANGVRFTVGNCFSVVPVWTAKSNWSRPKSILMVTKALFGIHEKERKIKFLPLFGYKRKSEENKNFKYDE